jgi:hypothetical protein
MLENDEGADFLPVKLAIVLIATTLVLTFTIPYPLALIDRSSTVTARAAAARIAATALAEYAEGCPGAGEGVRADVTIPANVRMIVFGPEKQADSYTIYYRDGSSETYFAGAPLGAGGPVPACGGPLALYPGRYSVRIRIEAVNGSLTALLYPEAA